jgi:fructokinase
MSERSMKRARDVLLAAARAHAERRSDLVSRSDPNRPVVIGEVSLVAQTAGAEVLEGSALTIVQHLCGFGFDPVLLTRITDGDGARRLVDTLDVMGADTSGVQVASTGSRRRASDLETAAFDSFDPDGATQLIDRLNPPLVFQCISGLRSSASRAAMCAIQEANGVPFFVDVDLGRSWMSPVVVRQVLLGSKWIRIRAQHLPDLAPSIVDREHPFPESAARSVQRSFALDQVFVDTGGVVSLLVSANGVTRTKRLPSTPTRHRSELRDASAATLVAGIVSEWSDQALLEQTTRIAQLVRTVPGGVDVEPIPGLPRDVRAADCEERDGRHE